MYVEAIPKRNTRRLAEEAPSQLVPTKIDAKQAEATMESDRVRTFQEIADLIALAWTSLIASCRSIWGVQCGRRRWTHCCSGAGWRAWGQVAARQRWGCCGRSWSS
jgi:hypothetical protein